MIWIAGLGTRQSSISASGFRWGPGIVVEIGGVGAERWCNTRTRVMKRLAVIALALVALAVPVNANAALFFLFDQPSAAPNDRMTVRTGGTPKNFKLKQRVKPL